MPQDVRPQPDLAEIVRTIPTTPDDFLVWTEAHGPDHPGIKFELARGKVQVMRMSTTRAHVRICGNLLDTINRQLDREKFEAFISDFAVRTRDGVREPDVVVEPLNLAENALASEAPIFLVEVLSPSSVGRDFTEKVPEYGDIASVQSYLICSQDEPRTWIWRRTSDGTWPAGPEEVAGREPSISIPGLGIALTMRAIYRNIADPPA